jgi:DNA-binding LytR/AlgR family response regulator
MEKELLIEPLIEFQSKTAIAIISKGKVVSIRFDEITHVSKYGNESVVYTAESSYRTYYSMQEILNDLPVNDFFRIHRSHIISLKHINGVKRKRIRVGEYYLPVSKYFKIQLIKSLQQILDKECSFFCEPDNKTILS